MPTSGPWPTRWQARPALEPRPDCGTLTVSLTSRRVRGSSQRALADIVALVRYAIGSDDELVPFAEQVEERFSGWLAMQEVAGRDFTDEQRQWLEDIKDHIAGSVSIDPGDLQYAPFAQRGGIGRAYAAPVTSSMWRSISGMFATAFILLMYLLMSGAKSGF